MGESLSASQDAGPGRAVGTGPPCVAVLKRRLWHSWRIWSLGSVGLGIVMTFSVVLAAQQRKPENIALVLVAVFGGGGAVHVFHKRGLALLPTSPYKCVWLRYLNTHTLRLLGLNAANAKSDVEMVSEVIGFWTKGDTLDSKGATGDLRRLRTTLDNTIKALMMLLAPHSGSRVSEMRDAIRRVREVLGWVGDMFEAGHKTVLFAPEGSPSRRPMTLKQLADLMLNDIDHLIHLIQLTKDNSGAEGEEKSYVRPGNSGKG